MKLTHYDDAKVIPNRSPTSIHCKDGWGMSSIVQKLAIFCKSSTNDREIIWASAHLTILVWFPDEKYRTYFNLKGLLTEESR